MGPKQAAAAARRLAYQADPAGSLDRGRTARKDRRVTCRPAPDTMSLLHAFLPVEQGVACYAALTQHTDTVKASGDDRSRDQIMADTLVERLTGQATADAVNAEINLVMPLDALLDPDDPTAGRDPRARPDPRLAGPPTRRVRRPARRWWRRLFTAPAADGGADRRRRPDPAPLRRLAGQTHHPPRPNLPRALLHRTRSGTWTTSPRTATAA